MSEQTSETTATAQTVPPQVTMTERAAKQIAKILQAEGKPDSALRVSVSGGGCSGFSYGFDIDDERADDDFVIERDGVTVLVDEVSLEYMTGSQIDYVDELIGSSFKITNPNATASCGCGTSFAL